MHSNRRLDEPLGVGLHRVGLIERLKACNAPVGRARSEGLPPEEEWFVRTAPGHEVRSLVLLVLLRPLLGI